jgi:hypothetical protein
VNVHSSFHSLDSPESETYYHLGCACLSLRSVFDSPEVYTVQAVLLMAAFHTWGGKKHTMDSAVSLRLIGADPCLIFVLVGFNVSWCQASTKCRWTNRFP